MERRGKSSPALRRRSGHVNPIRSNTVEDIMRALRVLGGGVEQIRQRSAKIDGCSRQNPAYRSGRKPKNYGLRKQIALRFLKPFLSQKTTVQPKNS